MDIIYDSYLEESVKEGERIRRRNTCEPLEYYNLTRLSKLPVQMERFWACGKNKEQLQIMSRQFYIDLTKRFKIKILLSGYVTDNEGLKECVQVTDGNVQHRQDLDSEIEEADCRIIPHIAKAGITGHQRIVVFSNDTDVVTYLLYYMEQFVRIGILEVWIRFGNGNKARYIPVHTLHTNLGRDLSKVVLKAHVLTGCDISSKVGTKYAALKCEPVSYLQNFGDTSPQMSEEEMTLAESYIIQLIQKKSTCETMDDLRYFLCTVPFAGGFPIWSDESLIDFIMGMHSRTALYRRLASIFETKPQ